VTIMMGRYMPLFLLAVIVFGEHVPECTEEKHHEQSKEPDRPGLCLLKHLDQAVHEGCHPEKPLQKSSQHDYSNYCHVYDLPLSASVGTFGRQTSFVAHGSVMPGNPPGPMALSTSSIPIVSSDMFTEVSVQTSTSTSLTVISLSLVACFMSRT
jgi:hypothetical protein